MAVTRFASHAGVGHPLMSATPDRFDADAGFAYVKGLMAPWLMATGLAPDAAWDLARRVEDHLARTGGERVSLDELRRLAGDVLGGAEGDETAERFRRWHDFAALDRPLVLLLGGATGVGKSTVATQLAHHLGITRVSSTDFIRQVLRSVVPDAIAPELSRSSFELDHEAAAAAPRHAEFERQARDVLVGVRATIERAAREGTPLIVEGIHLWPGLVDLRRRGPTASWSTSCSSVATRPTTSGASPSARPRRGVPPARYDDGLETIRELQAASRGGAPGAPASRWSRTGTRTPRSAACWTWSSPRSTIALRPREPRPRHADLDFRGGQRDRPRRPGDLAGRRHGRDRRDHDQRRHDGRQRRAATRSPATSTPR